MRGVVGIFLVLAVAFSPVGLAKKPVRPCPSVLADGKNHTSFALRYPSLFEEVLKIHRAVLDVPALRREYPRWTASRMLRKGVELRRSEAQRFRHLAELAAGTYKAPDFLVRELSLAAEELEVSETEYEKHRDGLLMHVRGATVEVTLDSPQARDTLNAVRSTTVGLQGEIELLFLLPGVIGRGVLVKDLPSAATLLRGFPNRYLDKEIDLIFEDGAAWAEIKNKRQRVEKPLPSSSDVAWHAHRKLVDQAREMAQIARRFSVPHHLFFRAGITPEAADELGALGVQVHGIHGPRPTNVRLRN